jgi:hypothetical protein
MYAAACGWVWCGHSQLEKQTARVGSGSELAKTRSFPKVSGISCLPLAFPICFILVAVSPLCATFPLSTTSCSSGSGLAFCCPEMIGLDSESVVRTFLAFP